MDNLRGWNDGFGREDGGVQILHNAFLHHPGDTLADLKVVDGSVCAVHRPIEGGNIEPFDLGRLQQEGFLLPTACWPVVELQQLHRDLFALAQ